MTPTFVRSLWFAIPAFLAASEACSQPQADGPAAAIASTCKAPDFDRSTLQVPVRVDLVVRVDERGIPSSTHALLTPPNPALEAAIVASALTCKYSAAVSDGRPAPSAVRLLSTMEPSTQPTAVPVPFQPANGKPTIADLRSCAPTADDYPPASRQSNETGTTRVTFTVGSDGKLTAFGVARSSGYLRLDFTALIKLASCKFTPGRMPDGRSVGGTFTADYVWKLE